MKSTLEELLKNAVNKYEQMTPEEKSKHDEAQRQSFVRGMTARCEHGVIDFEDCPICRGLR